MELGPSGRGGAPSGRDLEIMKDRSRMEGSSGRKLTSGKLDVTNMVPNLGVFRTEVARGRPKEAKDAGWTQRLADVSEKSS